MTDKELLESLMKQIGDHLNDHCVPGTAAAISCDCLVPCCIPMCTCECHKEDGLQKLETIKRIIKEAWTRD